MKFIFIQIIIFLAVNNLFAETTHEKLHNQAIELSYNSDSLVVALDKSQHALELAKEKRDVKAIINYTRFIGGVYYRLGDFHKALEYTEESLIYAKRSKLVEQELKSESNLSQINMKIGNYDQALGYILSAYSKIDTNTITKGEIGKITNNLGLCYFETGNLDSASYFLTTALEIKKSINDTNSVVSTLHNISLLYKKLGDYDKSQYYLDQANLYIVDDYGRILQIINRANLWDSKGNIELAIKNYETALQLAKENNYGYLYQKSLKGLYAINKELQNYFQAMKYMEQLSLYQDSVINESSNIKNYEYDLKKQLVDLESQNNIIAKRSKNSSYYNYVLSIFFLITFIISFMYIKKNKQNIIQKNKDKEKLANLLDKERNLRDELNTTLENLKIHQIELTQQNEELKDTTTSLEKAKNEYYTLFNKATVGFIKCNTNFEITEVNFETVKILNTNNSKLIGKDLSDFISSDYQDDYYFHRNLVADTHEKNNIIIGFGTEDNKKYYRLESIFLETENGNDSIYSSLIDVTNEIISESKLQEANAQLEQLLSERTEMLREAIDHRMDTEQFLIESEEKYKHLTSILPIGVYQTTVDGKLLYCNKKFREILGIEGDYDDINVSQYYDDPNTRENIIKDVSKNDTNETKIVFYRNGERRVVLDICTANRDIDDKFESMTGVIQDITILERYQQELRYQANLLDQVEQLITATDENGVIKFWNKYNEKILGWKAHEVIGTKFSEIINIDKKISDLIGLKLNEGKSWVGELSIFNKYGKEVKLFSKNSPIHNDKGNFVGVVGISSNLDEITKIKAKYEKVQSQLNSIFDLSDNIYGIVDSNLKIKYLNNAFEKLTGYYNSKFYDKYFYEIASEHERNYLKTTTERAIKNNLLQIPINFSHQTANDEDVFLEVKFYKNENDTGEEMIFVIRDITKDIENQEQMKLLSTVAEQTINMVIITDADGKTLWVNKSFEILTGYTLDEMLGNKPGDILQGEETNEDDIVGIRQGLESGTSFSHTILNYNKKGEKYWLRVDISPIRNSIGEITKFIAIQTDITEIVEYQRKLKESELNLRAMFDSSLQSYFLINKDFKIKAFNKKSHETVEKYYNRNLIVGDSILDYSDPKTISGLKENITKAFEGIVTRKEIELNINNRATRWFDVQYIPVKDKKGEIFGVAFVSLDITEEKRSKLKIEEANIELKNIKNKLEEANSLKSIILGNLGHELRTPLNGILGFSKLLKDDVEEEQKEMVDYIISSGDRLNHTVNSLLFLTELESGHYKMNYETIDLNYFAESLKGTFESKVAESGLELILKKSPKEVPAFVDEYCLHQIAFQLIDNAIKYTLNGWITIQTGVVNSNNRLFSYLKFIDTGIGIKPESMETIFEPFRQGSEGIDRNFEGVGIGLTITKRMVEIMNGRIEVKSEVDNGSEFTIYLPSKDLKLN